MASAAPSPPNSPAADTASLPPRVIRARWPTKTSTSDWHSTSPTTPASPRRSAAAGDIDIVIANAGAIFYAAVEATPLPELQRLLNLNTIAAVRLAQAVLPQMRARGNGKLMFMSSVLGRVVRPPSAAYAATKWALEALVEALAIEVAPLGVQAALLEPGAVSSGALDDVTTHRLSDDPYTAILRGGGPRDGMITPEQVAAEVADAAEKPLLPLRIPIGDAARTLLAARHAAPDDVPFLTMTTVD